MAPVPWQPTYQPPRSNGPWRVVAVVLSTVVALLVTAVFVLTASNVTSGNGTALADTSKDITVHNLPNGDVQVTYPAGHFRATFPTEPTPQTVGQSVGGYTIAMHAAAIAGALHTLVAGIDLSNELPSAGRTAFLRGAAGVFGASGQSTVLSEGATTFQGGDGWQSVVRVGGSTLHFLVFFATARRAFMLIAPDGAAFDKLAASFVALR